MLVGGGLWFPERDKLARVREHIDQHPRRWRRALSHPDFQRVFFPELEGAKEGSADADALVEAFAERNAESALKKRPQGYDEDHRDIRLLRLKCFTVVKTVDDDALTGDDAQEQLRDVIRGLHPLVSCH